VATTPYLNAKLMIHSATQQLRISSTKGYNTHSNLVVADSMGNVPDLKYIRRYMHKVADRAGVPRIPPKNLRRYVDQPYERLRDAPATDTASSGALKP